jgi:hypothetical protein
MKTNFQIQNQYQYQNKNYNLTENQNLNKIQKQNNYMENSNIQDYIYNDIIIENQQQNVYIDLEKRIKILKGFWNNKEKFYSLLRDIDIEYFGENIYEDEIHTNQNNYNFNSINDESTSQINNNKSRSYIGNPNQNQIPNQISNSNPNSNPNNSSYISNTNRNK